jgi:hypothetical protein
MSVWVRRCLSFACLLAAWLVAHPAWASAPMCDPHAASALAPLPVLDAPDASLDISLDLGDPADSCEGWVARDKAYERGDRPAPGSASPLHVDVVLNEPVQSVISSVPVVLVPTFACGRPLAGVRSGLDRPPRPVAA